MIYYLPPTTTFNPTTYSTSSTIQERYDSVVELGNDLYDQIYYVTDFVPLNWTRYAGSDNIETLADYLYRNQVDSDSEIAQAISDHFWDF